MHPWEDFAECFAHYLHITDTIDTVREAGLVLHADQVRFSVPRDIAPLESYDDEPIERLLYDWKWLALFFNRVNTAMGKNPLYPFVIPRAGDRQAGVHPPSDPRDCPRTGRHKESLTWAMPTNCSTSPIGWCWSPAAAAASAARWRSPPPSAAPTSSSPAATSTSCVATAEEIAAATGRTAFPYQVHVGRWDQLDGLVDAAYERFGKVDVLINNAGMSPLYDSLTLGHRETVRRGGQPQPQGPVPVVGAGR